MKGSRSEDPDGIPLSPDDPLLEAKFKLANRARGRKSAEILRDLNIGKKVTMVKKR
jgi:hypothetical protein